MAQELNSANIRKPSVYTPGEVERTSKERNAGVQKTLGEINRQIKHNSAILQKELLGNYKKTITDVYVSIFANNYDDAVDYYSLMDSFTFNVRTLGGKVIPSYTININHIQFVKDAKANYVTFNENSIDDFIANDDLIEGKYTDALFTDSQEEEGFIKNKDYNTQEQKIDGLFVSTSDRERYSIFNKINKLGGYMSPEESVKESAQLADKIWSKQENKIINNITKKLKI